MTRATRTWGACAHRQAEETLATRASQSSAWASTWPDGAATGAGAVLAALADAIDAAGAGAGCDARSRPATGSLASGGGMLRDGGWTEVGAA